MFYKIKKKVKKPSRARLLSDRFLNNTEIKEKGCWVWVGTKYPNGYGRFGVFGKNVYAHRFAFEIFNLVEGEMPKGLFVCHSCDNPSCVNPEHLWLGTARDNALDREKKGRGGGRKLKGGGKT